MSSMEVIWGEPSRLVRLVADIHKHYVLSCAADPERVQKATIVRTIAYKLLLFSAERGFEAFTSTLLASVY